MRTTNVSPCHGEVPPQKCSHLPYIIEGDGFFVAPCADAGKPKGMRHSKQPITQSGGPRLYQTIYRGGRSGSRRREGLESHHRWFLGLPKKRGGCLSCVHESRMISPSPPATSAVSHDFPGAGAETLARLPRGVSHFGRRSRSVRPRRWNTLGQNYMGDHETNETGMSRTGMAGGPLRATFQSRTGNRRFTKPVLCQLS